jgi:aspartyl-tRNA(Asn)/glutamyl-tRNA(Gln) amidotransferase subunit A
MLMLLHAAAEAIRSCRLSPVELVENCLDQIDRYEPHVHAWVLIDRHGAWSEAERLAADVRNGNWRGPLHGIPIGVKDIIDVAGWPTAAGSRLWANRIATHDAPVIGRLRQAGAILLGKTVTTPYASFDPPPTKNPWDLTRTPGGSSSGSAAAVACGMCTGALGSQTGGSLVRPASYCGVAAFKPSFGRVSVAGLLPLAPSMDHVGSIARSVKDLAIIQKTLEGPGASDMGAPLPSAPRLGRLAGLFADLADASAKGCVDHVIECLQSRGAAFVDVILPAAFDDVLSRHRLVMAVEAAAYHQSRLQEHPEEYGPQITSLLREGLACSAAEYVRTKEHQRRLTAEMPGCFDGVDALLTPATTGPASAADTTGNPAFNSPWSYTGLPTVSLPAGWAPNGLPLAIQLVGRPGSDAQLLATAAWCEEAIAVDARLPPLPPRD